MTPLALALNHRHDLTGITNGLSCLSRCQATSLEAGDTQQEKNNGESSIHWTILENSPGDRQVDQKRQLRDEKPQGTRYKHQLSRRPGDPGSTAELG